MPSLRVSNTLSAPSLPSLTDGIRDAYIQEQWFAQGTNAIINEVYTSSEASCQKASAMPHPVWLAWRRIAVKQHRQPFQTALSPLP